jgi:ABC-type tungstate transport system permease subunit
MSSVVESGQVWEATWSFSSDEDEVFLVLKFENDNILQLFSLSNNDMINVYAVSMINSNHWRRIA